MKTIIRNRDKLIPWEEVMKGFSDESKKRIESYGEAYRNLTEIRVIRREKNMTQDDLSKKCKVPRATISKIENGQRNVTLETLIKVSAALDRTVKISFKN